jgi:hypothetical protein
LCRRERRGAEAPCPQRDSNPCFRLERAMSWATRRWGLSHPARGSRPSITVGPRRPPEARRLTVPRPCPRSGRDRTSAGLRDAGRTPPDTRGRGGRRAWGSSPFRAGRTAPLRRDAPDPGTRRRSQSASRRCARIGTAQAAPHDVGGARATRGDLEAARVATRARRPPIARREGRPGQPVSQDHVMGRCRHTRQVTWAGQDSNLWHEG